MARAIDLTVCVSVTLHTHTHMLLTHFTGDVNKDGEDSCHSSSLDSSDTRSDPHHSLQSDVASFSEDTSLTSYSMDTQSCSSMAMSEGGRESPDSAVHHRRRTSAGLAWGSRGLSPLKSVFNRTK